MPKHQSPNHRYDRDANENISTSTGIEGRTLYVLLIILLFLMMLCIFNLIMLIVVYTILNIGPSGMDSLAFHSDGRLQWLQESDLEYVLIQNGIIGGFNSEDMTFNGNNQNVSFGGGIPETRSLYPHAQRNILHLGKGSNIKLNGNNIEMKTLRSDKIHVGKVLTNNDDLLINGYSINVTGNEGLFMDSKAIRLSTEQGDLQLKVQDINSALILSGKMGTYLDSIPTSNSGEPNQQTVRYKLCGCVNNGRLFRLQVEDGNPIHSCALATTNPCL